MANRHAHACTVLVKPFPFQTPVNGIHHEQHLVMISCQHNEIACDDHIAYNYTMLYIIYIPYSRFHSLDIWAGYRGDRKAHSLVRHPIYI